MPQVFPDFPIGVQLWPQARRRPRVLREGYLFSLIENTSDTFHFSILAGMQRVRAAMERFARSLPDEAFFILEFYTDDAGADEQSPPPPTIHYSPYMPTEEILATLEPYWERLMQDGFVGFGLANNRASQEMFYSEEKVLTCFTDNHIRLMDLLGQSGIPHRDQLLLHTDMGHDHLSLLCHDRSSLPASLRRFADRDLDYACFCRELIEELGMYPVEESLSFFFSRREQQKIDALLEQYPDYQVFADEDFGTLLLDWNDFVQECCTSFEGGLWEYRMGLQLRDLIQYIIDRVEPPLAERILEAIREPDEHFRQNLSGQRKRLDHPGAVSSDDHFWYNGVIRNAGAGLRRDLIRSGWYKG